MIDSGEGGGPGAQGLINGTQREGTNARLSKSLPVRAVLSFLKVGRSWEKKKDGGREAGGERDTSRSSRSHVPGIVSVAASGLWLLSQIRALDLCTAEISADRIILKTCADPSEGRSARTNGRRSSTNARGFDHRHKGAWMILHISILKDTSCRRARVRNGVIAAFS